MEGKNFTREGQEFSFEKPKFVEGHIFKVRKKRDHSLGLIPKKMDIFKPNDGALVFHSTEWKNFMKFSVLTSFLLISTYFVLVNTKTSFYEAVDFTSWVNLI